MLRAGNATPGSCWLFMGSSCCSTRTCTVWIMGERLSLQVFGMNKVVPNGLDLDGASGNFIGYEIMWQPILGNPKASDRGTANGFGCTFTITISGFMNSYVNLVGTTPGQYALLGDSFSPALLMLRTRFWLTPAFRLLTTRIPTPTPRRLNLYGLDSSYTRWSRIVSRSRRRFR